MKSSTIFKNNVNMLGLPQEIYKKLICNNVNTLEQLWETNKYILRNVGFSNEEINTITIKLQLLGLDLNKKKYF